jgi:hypothetical protein
MKVGCMTGIQEELIIGRIFRNKMTSLKTSVELRAHLEILKFHSQGLKS